MLSASFVISDWFKAVQGLMSCALASTLLALVIGLFSLCCECKGCNPNMAAGAFANLTCKYKYGYMYPVCLQWRCQSSSFNPTGLMYVQSNFSTMTTIGRSNKWSLRDRLSLFTGRFVHKISKWDKYNLVFIHVLDSRFDCIYSISYQIMK